MGYDTSKVGAGTGSSGGYARRVDCHFLPVESGCTDVGRRVLRLEPSAKLFC